MRGDSHDRYQALSDRIIENMSDHGEFIRVNRAMVYYMPAASRRPVYIAKKSDELEMFLCNEYELNPTETECEFVMGAITAHVSGFAVNGTEQVLSCLNVEEQAMYLHLGGPSLLRIDADNIREVPNGYGNMVFPWSPAGDTIDPATNGQSARNWWEYLFADAVKTAADISGEEASAILACWFMFLLFRHMATSRPILATLGAPGSGKTVLFKRVYCMLYGDTKAIGSITRPDDFDFAVASNPFVAFDNIDINTRWLPDRLAQVSSVTDIERRQLYQDKATILLRRHALVGVTSHNPEFTRADVADRLLIITLRRWEHHLPEGIIIRRLMDQRDRLWGGVVRSIQDVLGTPLPREEDAPRLRIQDFAYLGLWFARAMGLESAFLSGLNRLALLQRTFALSEEQLLVECLDKMNLPIGWMPAGELFRVCANACNDGGNEFRFQYKNAATLGRRLVALQHPLRDFFTIEWKHDHKHGRMWKISSPIDVGRGKKK